MSLVRTILSLYDRTGNWAKPYKEAGYDVVCIDKQTTGHDIRLMKMMQVPIYGILAAPPCTKFAASGARWERTEAEMLDALSMVDVVFRFVAFKKPKFWVIENPIGKLSLFLGKPRVYFDPSDYGDPYTKRTCLWGEFNPPPKTNRVEATEGSKMHLMSPSPERANLRSETPLGFSYAFFEVNR